MKYAKLIWTYVYYLYKKLNLTIKKKLFIHQKIKHFYEIFYQINMTINPNKSKITFSMISIEETENQKYMDKYWNKKISDNSILLFYRNVFIYLFNFF